METKRECTFCKNTAQLQYDKYPGYQEPDTFQIYFCPTCKSSFSYPSVDTNKIYESIYQNGNKVPGYARYWEFAQHVKGLKNPLDYLTENEVTYWGVKQALSTISSSTNTSTKILEIGSGLGYLTYSLNKANYNVVGLDISNTAVDQANKTYGDYYMQADIFEYAKTNPEKFDIVILTEVIEHIDKPLEFIKAILAVLKPKGVAIITTPNKSLYPEKVIWVSDLPPVHCWWFSEESMKFVAKELNLKIQFIDFSNFYKFNFRAVNKKVILKNILPEPILNKDGQLLRNAVLIEKTALSKLKSVIFKIPYLKYIYSKTKRVLSNNDIICYKRSVILCSIFQKN